MINVPNVALAIFVAGGLFALNALAWGKEKRPAMSAGNAVLALTFVAVAVKVVM